MKMYFGLALPSYVMLALDWWVWELMVVISGLLGVKEQAATVVVMNLAGLIFQFALGFESGSTVVIG